MRRSEAERASIPWFVSFAGLQALDGAECGDEQPVVVDAAVTALKPAVEIGNQLAVEGAVFALMPTDRAAIVTTPIRESARMKVRCLSGVHPSRRLLAEGTGSNAKGSEGDSGIDEPMT